MFNETKVFPVHTMLYSGKEKGPGWEKTSRFNKNRNNSFSQFLDLALKQKDTHLQLK